MRNAAPLQIESNAIRVETIRKAAVHDECQQSLTTAQRNAQHLTGADPVATQGVDLTQAPDVDLVAVSDRGQRFPSLNDVSVTP